MAHIKKSQKKEIDSKRSDCFCEEFTYKIKRVKDFYRIVSVLNHEYGHGNWTTVGRPLRKIRRVSYFNLIASTLHPRDEVVVFRVPKNSDIILSRLALELS